MFVLSGGKFIKQHHENTHQSRRFGVQPASRLQSETSVNDAPAKERRRTMVALILD